MKFAKRLIAASLTLAMSLSLAAPALAVEAEEIEEDSSIVVSEEQIQTEISAMTDDVYKCVYDQLEEQDALGLLDAFMDYFAPQIEEEVRTSHGLAGVDKAGGTMSFTLKNGGAIGYIQSREVEVLATYYTAEQYQRYVADSLNVAEPIFTLSIEKILEYLIKQHLVSETALATISGWGAVYSILTCLSAVQTTAEQKSIANAGGYAKITSMEALDGSERGTVVYGWSNYPTAILSEPSNICVKQF